MGSIICLNSRLWAGIAQLVEQAIRNRQVAGSIPVSSTSFSNVCIMDFASLVPLPRRPETESIPSAVTIDKGAVVNNRTL